MEGEAANPSLKKRETMLDPACGTGGLAMGARLTFAPVFLQIYPEFANGPFAWRAAAFLSPERRSHLKLIAPADLDSFLAGNPPAGVLTGFDDSALEKPLVSYAKRHLFHPVDLGKDRILWVPQSNFR